MELHQRAGKKPAHVKKDVPGFIGNRLQHALWREAISLVENGICDAETVDAVIKASFGRRIAVLGPARKRRSRRHRSDACDPRERAAGDRQPPGAVALPEKACRRRQARLQIGRGLSQVERRRTGRLARQGRGASESIARQVIKTLRKGRGTIRAGPRETSMTNKEKWSAINRRSVVAGGLGTIVAPAVLRIIPANAQSKGVKSRPCQPAHRPACRLWRSRRLHSRSGERHPEPRACRSAARPIRSRSSPRTANRAAPARRKSRPN